MLEVPELCQAIFGVRFIVHCVERDSRAAQGQQVHTSVTPMKLRTVLMIEDMDMVGGVEAAPEVTCADIRELLVVTGGRQQEAPFAAATLSSEGEGVRSLRGTGPGQTLERDEIRQAHGPCLNNVQYLPCNMTTQNHATLRRICPQYGIPTCFYYHVPSVLYVQEANTIT